MLNLLFCLLLADAPLAVVKAPATAAPGDLVILDASASVGDLFLWESIDHVPVLAVDGGRRLVFATGRPGTYRFLLFAVGIVNARPVVAKAAATVKIEAPAPPPPPEPTPPPPAPTPPGPTPMPGKLYATLVFSEPALTPEAAALRADAAVGPALGALDCHWSECESSSAEFAVRNIRAFVEGKKLPVVIVQRLAGPTMPAPVVATFAPKDAADVIAHIKALRGRP